MQEWIKIMRNMRKRLKKTSERLVITPHIEKRMNELNK
jgi:ribosomal protein L19E